MTADDALKIAEDMENRSERARSTLNNKALVALAAEVRLLRADGYRRGMEDMRDKIISMCDQEGYGWPADMIRAIKTEGEL